MSKYEPLWKWIKTNGQDCFLLSFIDIEHILGFCIDHSFLTYKKELEAFGYKVAKISLKEQTILFEKQNLMK